jgi:hypothetical protein
MAFLGQSTYNAAMSPFKMNALLLMLVVLVLSPILRPGTAWSGVTADHELSVRLFPNQSRLEAVDRITLSSPGDGRLSLAFRPDLAIRSLTWNGRPAGHSFSGRRMLLNIPPNERGVLVIEYEGIFNDPFQARPATTDNPGQGVTGTISVEGALLLPGSGWHPVIVGALSSYRLKVTAPKGMHAVSLGRLVAFAVEGGLSVTEWEVDRTVEGLPLCAGPYELKSLAAGEIPVQTFLFPGNRELAPVYLRSTADHLRFYSDLHGPYAFPKFAVVENFFPTGYGFASFTLLGSQVLRLPFIPETSLRHEVAHCWWGNGVLVDYARGNWSEGLTTYVADYLSRELRSQGDAAEYRLQSLRDFALLAAGQDFPLSRFVSRTDPASRAVGYGKAMFVFHMARRQVGDGPFWEGLGDIYKEKLFREATWADFGAAFARRGGWSGEEAERFFRQWIDREGGPALSVERPEVVLGDGVWTVKATIRQKGSPFDLRLPIVIETQGGKVERVVHIAGSEHKIELTSNDKPTRLSVDPDHHVFKVLAPEEVPPTVNSIRGSVALAAVLADERKEMEGILRTLLASLNQPGVSVVRASAARPQDVRGRDLLVLGMPGPGSAVPPPPSTIDAQGRAVPVAQVQGGRSIFVVTSHPEDPSRKVAYLLPGRKTGPEQLLDAARKVTHYGKYSLLAFDGDTVVERVVADSQSSPLVVDLEGP